ncbi:MAG: hypothetical protein U9R36_01475, partial [Elusimicrobiota bacterium]|nr:hypothetical protein [Elusimicrobiota bacterium]
MKNIAINIFLTLASLLLIIGGMEIGARIYKGQYGFKNFLKARKNLFRSAYVSQFDRELGWVPKKGRHPKNIWKTRVTILDDGIRSNGEDTEKRSEDNVILAVGDSFTFGDQVSDNETWPAFLEKMSGRRVINGGVTGYGADQVFLRMKLLAGKFDPDIIIFGLIAKDIRRCEFSEFAGVKKPFFKLSKDRQLLLTTNHVSYFPSRPLSVSRRILGYSFIIHKLMVRTFPRYWLQGLYKNTIAHLNGEEVVCGIFNKLKDFARDNKIDIYV